MKLYLIAFVYTPIRNNETEIMIEQEIQKLIGFKLDTNQFTSKTIENLSEATIYLDKVIELYGLEIHDYMFLSDDKRYTTFKKCGISLSSVLNCA